MQDSQLLLAHHSHSNSQHSGNSTKNLLKLLKTPLTLLLEHPSGKNPTQKQQCAQPGGLSQCCLALLTRSSQINLILNGWRIQACTDSFKYRRHFSRNEPYGGSRETFSSHFSSLPLVPCLSLFVLTQGAVKPAQVDHGDMVRGAQVDGLSVVGHGSFRSPWRRKHFYTSASAHPIPLEGL